MSFNSLSSLSSKLPAVLSFSISRISIVCFAAGKINAYFFKLGDQYVVVKIVMPDNIKEGDKKIFEELAESARIL